jgi:hypothetical protein
VICVCITFMICAVLMPIMGRSRRSNDNTRSDLTLESNLMGFSVANTADRNYVSGSRMMVFKSHSLNHSILIKHVKICILVDNIYVPKLRHSRDEIEIKFPENHLDK